MKTTNTLLSTSNVEPEKKVEEPALSPAPVKQVSLEMPEFKSSRVSVGDEDLSTRQLDSILNKNSPLMQRAKTQGMQYANSRGLVNSTIAGEAAQGAMIDRATPLAQQDAQTNLQAKMANQQADNSLNELKFSSAHESIESEKDRQQRLEEQRIGQEHEASILESQQGFESGENQALRSFQAAQNEIERAFEASQLDLERKFEAGESAENRALQLQELETQTALAREELARNTATELFRQVAGQQASLVDAIAQVQAADLDGENKQALVNTLINLNTSALNTTSALADFEIVDGQVVYGGADPEAAKTAPGTTTENPSVPGIDIPYTPYMGNTYQNYGRGNFGGWR